MSAMPSTRALSDMMESFRRALRSATTVPPGPFLAASASGEGKPVPASIPSSPFSSSAAMEAWVSSGVDYGKEGRKAGVVVA